MANAKKRRYEQKTEALPGLRLEAKSPKVDLHTGKPAHRAEEVKTTAWQDEVTIHRLIDFFKGF